MIAVLNSLNSPLLLNCFDSIKGSAASQISTEGLLAPTSGFG